MTKKVGIEIEVDTNGAVKSFRQLGDSGKNAGDKIDTSFNGASKSVGNFDLKTIGAIASVGGLVAVTINLTKAFVDLGIESTKNAERVETQFKTILGSGEAAQERFQELSKFAASTPFDTTASISWCRTNTILRALSPSPITI